MRFYSRSLTTIFCLATIGCSKSKSPDLPSSPTPAPPASACDLLTAKEIESVQGAPLVDAKPSQGTSGETAISQCYFTLPTASDSIAIAVVRKSDGASAGDPKMMWREIFARELAREPTEKKGDRRPEPVLGLGDEAFWKGQSFGGVLFVLKGDVYIRLSLGGPGDPEKKLQQAKDLAALAVTRL